MITKEGKVSWKLAISALFIASLGCISTHAADEYQFTLDWLVKTLGMPGEMHKLSDPEAFYAGVRRLQLYDEVFAQWESRFRVPKMMLWATALVESGGHPMLRSPAGAYGLLQCMPRTHRLMVKQYRTNNFAESGAAYYGEMFYTFSCNRLKAWAAYNAGPDDGRRFPRRLRRETKRYVLWCEWAYAQLVRNGPGIENEAKKFALEKILGGDTWTAIANRVGRSVEELKGVNPYLAIFGLQSDDYVAYRVYP